MGDIKSIISGIFGLNPLDFHISSVGFTLDEARSYPLTDDTEILVIPAPSAGGRKAATGKVNPQVEKHVKTIKENVKDKLLSNLKKDGYYLIRVPAYEVRRVEDTQKHIIKEFLDLTKINIPHKYFNLYQL